MKRKALLIGLNEYQLLGPLKYARRDAEAFAEALKTGYGFEETDIVLMTCGSAGALKGLSRYIEHALTDAASERDLGLLVFGFWGHGFAPRPGRRYLCGVDTIMNDPERTAVSMDVVKGKLEQAGALNTLVVLDCCRNRATGRGAAEPMTEGEERSLSELARDLAQASAQVQTGRGVPSVVVLNSCREGQCAYEWDERKHGVFTAHLLDGFSQGIGSVAQLAYWASDRVRRTSLSLHREEQTPFVRIEGRGDIALGGEVRTARPTVRVAAPSPPSPPPPLELWHVAEGGKASEGMLFGELLSRIGAGRVNMATPVWRAGMASWTVAGKVPELAKALAAAPSTASKTPGAVWGNLKAVEDGGDREIDFMLLAEGSREARAWQREYALRERLPVELESTIGLRLHS